MRNKAKPRHDPEKRARRAAEAAAAAAANNTEIADAAANENPEVEGEEVASDVGIEQAVEVE